MGRSSVYSDAFSDSSRSAFQPTGMTRHSKQQSSLSGFSSFNQPFIRPRGSADVGVGNLIGDGGGLQSTHRQSESLSRPPVLSSIQSTPTPSTISIPPASAQSSKTDSSPGATDRSPQVNFKNIRPSSPKSSSQLTHSLHRPSTSESGLLANVVPQYQLLERGRTVVLPLPPGAAKPRAPTGHEMNELGVRSRNRTGGGSTSSRGTGGSGVSGPRTRGPISHSLGGEVSSTSSDRQSGPGAPGSSEKNIG